MELGDDTVPDETTLLNFCHLLEDHNLIRKIFEDVNAYLGEKGLLLSGGSIVDATIIHAPSSTINKDKKRDPVRLDQYIVRLEALAEHRMSFGR